MELVNTLFASLAGTDPFTGVDITIANWVMLPTY